VMVAPVAASACCPAWIARVAGPKVSALIP
jgi:hypothetical protein